MTFENYNLLFCNGDPPRRERLVRLVPHPASVVCADGGAQKAIICGYEPDLIVGDLDSLDSSGNHLASAEIVRIANQDNTDMEKTLDVMLERGMNNIVVAAFSGGRIDQTLANIQIGFEYSRKCRIVLADDGYLIFPVTDSFVGSFPTGNTISILPMNDDTEVSSDGLLYELDGGLMQKGGHGVSNRINRENFSISVHRGGILVMIKDS